MIIRWTLWPESSRPPGEGSLTLYGDGCGLWWSVGNICMGGGGGCWAFSEKERFLIFGSFIGALEGEMGLLNAVLSLMGDAIPWLGPIWPTWGGGPGI